MPRWPAWAMFAAAAACAYPAMTTPPPGPEQEHYQARGQEPGWQLRIHNSRIDYSGDYGEVRITQLRPEPRPTANGRRYETERLIVDLLYQRCNDTMSGHGYEHQVTVSADRRVIRGCGGERRRDWDA
jgi:uncharacterized membrane protein